MDMNSLAKSIVDQATGEAPIVRPKEKSPKAVARGIARRDALFAVERSEIARDAANLRWAKVRGNQEK
ncbi:histone H1 [Granulicella mallensis]|uniref:Histone H1 n=1 Tax=Granulicella mallensis TaxID=940614 RepID=A0A7W7ZRL5_9BACT|nr:histone H1 [Granulicella mallensis]MBB5064484.1 hypothetical protein [Granulicella mallensis]